MKDMEETTSEASWNTVKKGKQEVWREGVLHGQFVLAVL